MGQTLLIETRFPFLAKTGLFVGSKSMAGAVFSSLLGKIGSQMWVRILVPFGGHPGVSFGSLFGSLWGALGRLWGTLGGLGGSFGAPWGALGATLAVMGCSGVPLEVHFSRL